MTVSARPRYCTLCRTPLEWRAVEPGRAPQPVCPACGHVHWQNPKPTASALVTRRRGGRWEVLLVRRGGRALPRPLGLDALPEPIAFRNNRQALAALAARARGGRPPRRGDGGLAPGGGAAGAAGPTAKRRRTLAR